MERKLPRSATGAAAEYSSGNFVDDLASVLGGVVLCPRPLVFDPFRQYRDPPLTGARRVDSLCGAARQRIELFLPAPG